VAILEVKETGRCGTFDDNIFIFLGWSFGLGRKLCGGEQMREWREWTEGGEMDGII